MPEAPGTLRPVNWTALVAEAIRRRKTEHLTQKEHAALASVSVPTIIAFDRGERTLSLAKAFDILRVVGLLEEPVEATSQETFVGEAFARWRDLTKNLPQASPGRFPRGWYRIDYALDGNLKPIELRKFTEVLRKAVVPHTGWPMFWLPRRQEIAAREIDGTVECWLPPDSKDVERVFYNAAHCDFWRAAPEGRAVLIRGYQEDAQETIPEGTIFDTTLPIWRTGEAFLHAARLAKLLAEDPAATTIKLRNLYTGLLGRDLRAWASPMSVDYFGGGRSRTDEAMLEGTAPAATVENDLCRYVYPFVSSLFERFGVTGISERFVSAELDRMRANNFGNRAAL
jgi:transcriptional regulator with XRE-family HTH domain